MTIQVFEYGHYIYSFEDTNETEVTMMANDLNSPLYDGMREYIDSDDGIYILRWPMETEEPDEGYGYSRVGVDFSPSNPWDAPGMSVSDFI